MDFDGLMDVARRRGLVRWTHSGLIEQLRVPRRMRGRIARVIARNLATKQDHPIFKHVDAEGKWPIYDCVEVGRQEMVTPAQLGFR